MTPKLDPESGGGASLCELPGGLSFQQVRAAAIGGGHGADPAHAARGAEFSPPGANCALAPEKAGQGGGRGAECEAGGMPREDARSLLYGKIAAGGDYGQAA